MPHNIRLSFSLIRHCATWFTLTISVGSLSAEPLVYEGFNYGKTSIPISGIEAGGGAMGITGTYSTVSGPNGNENSQISNYTPTGLSFDGLSHTGGALIQSVHPTLDGVKEFVYTHITLQSSATGDIYQAFLVNVSKHMLTNSPLGLKQSSLGISDIRIQKASTITGNPVGSMNTFFRQAKHDTIRVGTSYTATSAPANRPSIKRNTTYLFIIKYTGVGIDEGEKSAEMWALDEPAFVAWMTIGGGLESTLDTHSIISTDHRSTSPISFDPSRSLRISTAEFPVDFNAPQNNYSNLGEITVTYDEIRYGNTLEDVIVVFSPDVP